MKLETNKLMLVTLIVVLLVAASMVTPKSAVRSQDLPASVAVTSDQVVEFNNGAVPSNMIPDGRNDLVTNTFGVPVLITDIQVRCSSGTCNDVAILPPQGGNPPNRFHVRFGSVTVEPEYRALTTGFIWKPGEPVTYFKTGGGALRITFTGRKLSS